MNHSLIPKIDWFGFVGFLSCNLGVFFVDLKLQIMNTLYMNKFYHVLVLFFGFGIVAAFSSVSAQVSGIFIHRELDPGVAYNGQTIQVTSEEGFLYEVMYVQNISGQEQVYRWERVRLSVSSPTIEDQLCDDMFCVDCIGELWTAGYTVTIADTDSSLFKPQISVGAGANATYKYYIKNEAGVRLDSVTVQFTSTLSASVNEPVAEVKVFPNPTSGLVTIKNAVQGAEIQFFDMLGKLYRKETIQGATQTVNLSELPDGVYFYTIKQPNGAVLPAKKLVVRH